MSKEGIAEVLPARHGQHRYRDELNFAEFPIASVSDTIAENLHFPQLNIFGLLAALPIEGC